MIGNVIAGVVVIVGFLIGIAIVGFSFSFSGIQGYVFVLGVLVITGSIGVPLAVLGRID